MPIHSSREFTDADRAIIETVSELRFDPYDDRTSKLVEQARTIISKWHNACNAESAKAINPTCSRPTNTPAESAPEPEGINTLHIGRC